MPEPARCRATLTAVGAAETIIGRLLCCSLHLTADRARRRPDPSSCGMGHLSSVERRDPPRSPPVARSRRSSLSGRIQRCRWLNPRDGHGFGLRARCRTDSGSVFPMGVAGMVPAVRDRGWRWRMMPEMAGRCPASVPGTPSSAVLPVRGPLAWRAPVRAALWDAVLGHGQGLTVMMRS